MAVSRRAEFGGGAVASSGDGPAALGEALFGSPAAKRYAVADGAARPDLLETLWKTDARFACLFNGELEPEVAACAPYLIELEGPEGAFAELVAGWGQAQAVYLTSGLGLPWLRGHLARVTRAVLPGGRQVTFRFYDPRVLRLVVPVMEPHQRVEFFGDAVEAFFCEDEDGIGLVSFGRDR